MVMVQLNRNEVLSRIGKSVPNRFQLDGNFVKPLLTYVALPILGLLTIQFLVWPGSVRLLGGLSQCSPCNVLFPRFEKSCYG